MGAVFVLILLLGVIVLGYLHTILGRLSGTRITASKWKIQGQRVTLMGWQGETVVGLLHLRPGSSLALTESGVEVDGCVIAFPPAYKKDRQLRFFEDLERHLDRGCPETEEAASA